MRVLFPSRALALLLLIGTVDLVLTVVLSSHGLIDERNPLMAPLLVRSGAGFALVKAATLGTAWALLARSDPRVVRWACLGGSVVYVGMMGLALLTPG